MSTERTLHCDAEGCDIHQSTMRPEPSDPPGWVRVTEADDPEPRTYHFCCWNCVLKAASKIPPPEVIEWDDIVGGGA